MRKRNNKQKCEILKKKIRKLYLMHAEKNRKIANILAYSTDY